MNMKVKLTRPLKTDGCHMSYLVELQNILHDSKYSRVSEMKTIKRFGESSQHTSYHLIIMRQALNLRGEAASKDDFVTFLQHNS